VAGTEPPPPPSDIKGLIAAPASKPEPGAMDFSDGGGQ